MKNEIQNKKEDFFKIVNFIKKSKEKVISSVNTELIDLYWKIGKYISTKLRIREWGESIVKELAVFISEKYPDLKGYSDKNLWRMKQFYETYKDSKLSALLRELSWTNNLVILGKTKTFEERAFYLSLCIKEKYSKRQLERQIDSGYFERTLISSKKLSPLVRQTKYNIDKVFMDTYVFDFLHLPKSHSEKDLRKALLYSFKNFILEIGKDFAFVGEEYKVQVGKSDFFIDLLFYHRELKCLVAFELKITNFKPEYLGKLNFYLEALDRDVKKVHENPSVGVILCKSKDDEIVEYALSKNLAPALISEYKTKLINKKILKKKLHEFYLLSEN